MGIGPSFSQRCGKTLRKRLRRRIAPGGELVKSGEVLGVAQGRNQCVQKLVLLGRQLGFEVRGDRLR